MLITEHKLVTTQVYVAPCLMCGSSDIQLQDCGYSSFNIGGGECRACGHESTAPTSCLPSQTGLVLIWNSKNDIDVLIEAQQQLISTAQSVIDSLVDKKRTRALGDIK